MQLAPKPDPIDVRFGKLLRMTRTMRGMSQEMLGTMNGLTFQQIQKYERGTNRVSISRLVHMANSLGVPATWFIEKLSSDTTDGENPSEIDFATINKREVQELLHSYAGIADKEQRQFLRHITALLAVGGIYPDQEMTERQSIQ